MLRNSVVHIRHRLLWQCVNLHAALHDIHSLRRRQHRLETRLSIYERMFEGPQGAVVRKCLACQLSDPRGKIRGVSGEALDGGERSAAAQQFCVVWMLLNLDDRL